MGTPFRIPFAYQHAENANVNLTKLVLTNELDSVRIVVGLDETKGIESIKKVHTNTLEPINELTSYIENPDSEEKNEFPLLVRIDPTFNRLKLNVTIRPTTDFSNRSLIIVKSTGNSDIEKLKPQLYDDSSFENAVEISKLEYKKLPIEFNDHSFQRLIINDVFDKSIVNDSKLTISLWEHDPESNDYNYLLNFSVWIDTYTKEQTVENRSISSNGTTSEEKLQESRLFNLGDFRREFNLNIEDGPEFRKALSDYESRIPKAKKVYASLIEDFKALEQSLRRLSLTKLRIMEGINSLLDLHSKSLLQEFGFKRDFDKTFKSMFEPFEKNLKFFLTEVCSHSLLLKIAHNLSSDLLDLGLSGVGGASSNSQSSTSVELLQRRKQFENDSKEYYSWLNKYLSNEKERPESKLLAKRKAFEISKFDYLNHLNKITNNQYINGLWEDLFKFMNVKYDEHNCKFLDFNSYRDKKLSQQLIGENYQLYIHALLRFNSEKYQFRQKIEACQTNEELTNLIRFNRLSHHSMNKSTSMAATSSAITGTNDFIITPENIDLIFSDSQPPIESIASESEMSGILFALGGQGKQGWHKEWVVLNKGQLKEYADWRKGKTPINKPIEVVLSSVKPVTYDKRQFCFEIITSRGAKHVFQAINDNERDKWVKALYNAGQVVNTQRLKKRFGNNSNGHAGKSSSDKKKLGKLITNFVEKPENIGRYIADLVEKPIIPGQSKDRSVSPVSIISKAPTVLEKDYLTLVKSIPESDNNICLDCGSTESVEWVSINTLSCFCVQCASCHRNIGSHITRIRSLKLDKFDNEAELLLKYINNRHVNSFLEENMNPSEKINSNVTNEARLDFIRKKYQVKKYKSVIPDINNQLIKAIQKINIPDVLKYILCGGDININIQINIPNRTDYLVISLFEYSLRKFIEIEDDLMLTSEPKKLFIISELLILNGCKIDSISGVNSDLGLTEDATKYWKLRSVKLGGGFLTP
ncbi:GTPase activating protein [Spathaspora passalidarum NRRL Y-27907]|uniref:ADP-ribosylation factor GTPase-activating protein n=1 Tax=Spathaspora passalidarum (strain NRRL Y-27907 / 11-Y1) TaxID=619300 RepID=G3AFD8_SPAPN|nr:GTPase activating protein [Spathaspora passalidarum NRRL Y-27907]EGW34927.1 GTPase activating protein [Spathaspora passalidarum NRRL Y-27907]